MGNATTTFEGDLGSDPGRGIGDLEHKAQAFEDAFNAWDLDALLAMYEPDAIFVPEPGKVARGRTEIRQAFQGFVALKPRFSLNRSALHVLGDLALEWGTWTAEGTDRDGDPVKLSGRFTNAQRWQPDASWLLAIDDPFAFE